MQREESCLSGACCWSLPGANAAHAPSPQRSRGFGAGATTLGWLREWLDHSPLPQCRGERCPASGSAPATAAAAALLSCWSEPVTATSRCCPFARSRSSFSRLRHCVLNCCCPTFPRNMFTKERYTAHSPELGFVFQKASNIPKTILRGCQQDGTSCQHLLAPLSQRTCSLRNWSCRRMSPRHGQSPRLKMRQLQEGLTNPQKTELAVSWNILLLIRLLQGRIDSGLSFWTNLANLAFSWVFL